MPSTDSVNFSIRPNKNIERKLIARAIAGLNGRFDVSSYRYIGMGSFWFVDFVLFHKTLAITDMISIEHAEYGDRAEFNRPFKCIRIEPGDTTRVLPELELDQKAFIAWLDYDSDLNGPVLEDIRILCPKAPSSSIVLVTLNAHHGQLNNQYDENENELSRLEYLRRVAGELVPTTLEDKDTNAKNFPRTLAALLLNHCDHETRSAGTGMRFLPLFNFYYKDNAPMITIGGMIANESDERLLNESNLPAQFEYVTGNAQFDIKAPPLTLKERSALDRLLPADTVPSPEELQQKAGFKLDEEQISAYKDFYRDYPTFSERDS